MDRNIALEFVRVTEAAAMASSHWIGRGDKIAADKAATESMRARLNDIDFKGRIVIGEGERDEAPMLYIGEEVGNGNGKAYDIAVDPLEGTNLVAKGWANSISVLAASLEGNLLHAPDVYMDKIACGPEAKNKVSLEYEPEENIRIVAEALGKKKDEVTVAMMDRERHAELMKKVRSTGAMVRLITDGDLSAAVSTCTPDADIDLLLGVGGAPEGVISAAALKCLGGGFEGRLVFKNDTLTKMNEAQLERAKKMGVEHGKKLKMEDLAKGDVVVCATGITGGYLLKGVRFTKKYVYTHSITMSSQTKTVRFIEALHDEATQRKFLKK